VAALRKRNACNRLGWRGRRRACASLVASSAAGVAVWNVGWALQLTRLELERIAASHRRAHRHLPLRCARVAPVADERRLVDRRRWRARNAHPAPWAVRRRRLPQAWRFRRSIREAGARRVTGSSRQAPSSPPSVTVRPRRLVQSSRAVGLRRGGKNIHPAHTSKNVLQGQLNFAVVDGRAGDLTESPVPQASVRFGKLGRVESVEEFNT